jgi:hypothetical protein
MDPGSLTNLPAAYPRRQPLCPWRAGRFSGAQIAGVAAGCSRYYWWRSAAHERQQSPTRCCKQDWVQSKAD